VSKVSRVRIGQIQCRFFHNLPHTSHMIKSKLLMLGIPGTPLEPMFICRNLSAGLQHYCNVASKWNSALQMDSFAHIIWAKSKIGGMNPFSAQLQFLHKVPPVHSVTLILAFLPTFHFNHCSTLLHATEHDISFCGKYYTVFLVALHHALYCCAVHLNIKFSCVLFNVKWLMF